MTHPSRPHNEPDDGSNDLAALGADTTRPDVETVTVEVPNPDGSGESARISFEVPAAMAPMLRAEFSPERVAAMTQAMAAIAAMIAAQPPQEPGP